MISKLTFLFLTILWVPSLSANTPGKERPTNAAEIKKAVEAFTAQVNAVKAFSTKAVQDATKSNDASRVDCMAQPFTYLRALEVQAARYSSSVDFHLQSGDVSKALEELAKLETTMGKVNSVSDELKSCGGPPSTELTDSSVDMEKDKDLPEIEQVGLEASVLVPVLTRPALTSPVH